MLTWMIAAACHSEGPAVLVLKGPEHVEVEQLGAVDGPVVRLNDGTVPRGVIWTTSPHTVAQLEAGQVHAVGPGEASVVAEWEEQTVSWTLVVELAKVLVFVDPPAQVQVGQTVTLGVAARVGDLEADAGSVVWSSSAPQTLNVSEAGLASGVAAGTSWVTAVAGGAKAMLQVDVVD